MASTKEPKIKKDKPSKKSKPVGKIDTPKPTDSNEAVKQDDAPQEIKVKNEKKVKVERSTKKRKSTGDVPIADLTPEKSKRTRETEGSVLESKSPQLEEMEVDNNETAEEPPTKKRKSVVDRDELEVDVTKPQPPSKKELRRLKKGKSLPKSKTVSEIKAPKAKTEGEGDANGEDANENYDQPKKPEQEKRSEHGIWVGNLPWSVSKADLKTFLTANASITDAAITRIHMPSPDDKKPANKVESRFTRTQHNKGYAYVDFASEEDTIAAVALSEELLGGRRVLIKNNKSFEGRPLKAKDATTKTESKAPSKRVFLGNLRFDTTEESLKEHFERCGPIETCMVATFEDSGKCKGYAWITFAELEGAAQAVRGFVLEEEHDSDVDSEEEDEGEGDSDPEDYAQTATKKSKKAPMKRVYVNMIQRRPVRIEFAEDAQVRYRKRYGAGGTKNPASGDGERPEGKEEKVVSGVIVPSKTAAKIEYRTDYAPRLTGGIVASKGTKVSFD